MPHSVSRRTFLKTATATTAATCAARALPAWALVDRGAVAVDTPLATFGYADVALLDGPMKAQFDEHHARFLNLDDDRLLKVFRQVAGLPAPGEDMGGWYDLTGFSLERGDFHGFIAGHSFGQYVSGLSRAYAVTGSEATHAMVAYLPEKALSRAEQRSRPHKDTPYTWDESYTLPENFFLAYQRSGKSFYRDLGKQYLEDDTYFGPLSQ